LITIFFTNNVLSRANSHESIGIMNVVVQKKRKIILSHFKKMITFFVNSKL